MPKPSKKKQHVSNLKQERVKRLLHLGTQFHGQHNVQAAEVCYRQVIDADPLNFRALYLLGILHSDVGSFSTAIDFLKMAIKVNPKYSLAYNDIGVVYQTMGDVKNAVESYKTALELNANFSEAQNNLGVAYGSKGNSKKSIEHFKNAMEINPYYFDAFNNYIFALDLSTDQTVQSLQDIRRQWSKVHEEPLLDKHKPFTNDLTTNRKLRVGYISADFRLHSASFVFGAMISDYNRDEFEVYCYNNSNNKPDSRMVAFKESATHWRDIYGLKDEDVYNLVRKDKIDILIDLTGYSAGSRLLVFARRAAPIQVTAWGYATSTGMKSMDYFFADNVVVPDNEKSLYQEEVIHLPNLINHFCPERKPDVQELPALTNGFVTFGSFNRLAKVSEDAFRLWVEVLKAVPNSHIVLKIGDTADTVLHEWVLKNFQSGGITADRITFLGKEAWHTHMDSFNRFDIALDPFPHGGGITTVEGLTMGVPVITLRWPTIVGRLSSSLLTTLGMTDWIAETQDDYISLAVDKASKIQELSEVRKGLRDKINSSIIGDSVGYCRIVEDHYKSFWTKYIEKQSS